MAFTMTNNTNTTHVTATSDHAEVTRIEFDEVGNFVVFKIEDDGIIILDMGIRITDGATIMGNNVWDPLGANTGLKNLEKFELTFNFGDTMNGESALDIIKKTESFIGFFDGDDI